MEQIILPKNIFLPHFEIVQNFHYFERSAPVDFPSKIQFSKNCPKCCRNVLLMSGTNNFAKKYFLTSFWDSTKFSLFWKVSRLSIFCQKFNFPKTAPNVVEMFHLMSGTNNFARKYFLTPILPENIFLPHFEIVQNFHYFVRVAPVDFPSKIQFSKNCLKWCRNVSSDEWNK